MQCPKCKIEMRVDSKRTDSGILQEFYCRNKKCGSYLQVQKTVLLKKEEK